MNELLYSTSFHSSDIIVNVKTPKAIIYNIIVYFDKINVLFMYQDILTNVCKYIILMCYI